MNINELIFRVLSVVNKVIPKKNNEISIYGRRMLNDNSEALIDYLIEEGFNSKYKINIIIYPDVIHIKYLHIFNVRIISKSNLSLWRLMRSKYIFHSHGMTKCTFKPANGQIIFDLWHGSPLKQIGVAAGKSWHSEADSYFLCASPFMSQINKRCFQLQDKQIFIGSNPRNDKLFDNKASAFVNRLKRGRKMILFMPTFRNSQQLGEHDASLDIPILNEENITELDKFLSDKNTVLVIKPHPYQNEISLLKRTYQNIVIVRNDDIQKNNESLYALIGKSDALISDFSSVYFDYLLLNRPISFAIDDLNDYKTNRGFTVDNPLDLMPGKKLTCLKDLQDFIEDIETGNDNYEEERKRVNSLCNTFTTPDASKRILNFVGIQK